MDGSTLATRLRAMADGSYRDVPLYRRIAIALAERPALLAFTASLPEHALAGGLLFSTLHYLVLADGQDEFALAWQQETQATGSVSDFEPALERYVLGRAEEISTLVARHRGAQTNEVNRCAYLLPALATVAGKRRQPLVLLDVGSSAGLLLNFDRYSYRYNGVVHGPPSSVSIAAELRGRRPPLEVPDVGWRLGVDREPVDVLDEKAARWVLANVYPGDTERAARTDAALTLARQHPPTVIAGEAADVEDFARRAPHDLALTVVTTAVLMYLDPASRVEFRRAVERLGEDRLVDWVMCEPPGALADLGADVSALVEPYRGATEFVGPLVHIATDVSRPELLGLTGPHGRWLEWLVEVTERTPAPSP